ncbi:MAG TPA: hypothetical protein VM764_05925 [Gemmatimonadaceae bacterium]|nr:hypothetical protein [Gemmatimonadaceae bacterium]
MLIFPALALALQTTVSIGPKQEITRDDSTRRAPRRVVVTEEMRRTAFKDDGARDLLLRARAARMTQDSMLMSYDAKGYRRISVGMALRAVARDRLAFRTETAARVQWHRDAGARVTALGGRATAPIVGEGEQPMHDADMFAIPYYPGKEQLWTGSGGLAKAEVNDRELVHPVAEGSEAYYTFATGDSVIMTLPDGKRITLRELRIAAREPKWNVTVGSFWFETGTAHLVRAVYRLSTPMDLWAVASTDDNDMDEIPVWARAMMTPMTADITAISVEYGLYNQRFWLPKLQGLDGYARVGFLRVPVRFEERFSYESVNAIESLPKVPTSLQATLRAYRDSLVATGMSGRELSEQMRRYRAERDSVGQRHRRQQCESGESYTVYRTDHDGALTTAVQFPCDSARLMRSADLPPSIYDDGEELFGVKQRDELVKSLTMGLQPGWAPQKPTYEYGFGYTRFNRIEGFSTGAAVKHTLGNGYGTALTLRGSAADLQLNGEFSMTRSNGRRELRGTAYRRLAVSSDFGDPLSFGSSLASFLYARDEGFYHRAWGAEFAGGPPPLSTEGGLEWRLFAEQQWNAPVENRWSLFGGAHDERFIDNVGADKIWAYGTAARWRATRGLDPNGWRVATDLRAEAATGDRDYVRGLVEATVSRGLGPVAASLTGAVGSSGGELPAQRHFFLGGLHTIRGQTAGTGFGEAFWMSRLEIGGTHAGVRPVVFGDLGWAGPRDNWSEVGQPMSGVGIGASFLDGMIRMDLARGIHPKWQTRLDLYLEARF